MVAASFGCRSSGASDSPERRDAAIASDLQTLCNRIAARSVSAWGQAAMMTDEVQSLTFRIDQGDEAARCELGRLMKKHQPRTCRETSKGLVTRCER